MTKEDVDKQMVEKIFAKYGDIIVGLPNDIEMFQDIQVLAQRVRQLEGELAVARCMNTTDMLLGFDPAQCAEQ